MIQPAINYVAVVVAAIASMVLGSLWYGPVFGKLWMQLNGHTEKSMAEAKKKGMAQLYALAFVGSLVTAYVMAHFVDYLEATTISGGVQAGFWIWLGFIAPVALGSVLWDGKPWKLYFLNIAYYIIQLSMIGAILAVWA